MTHATSLCMSTHGKMCHAPAKAHGSVCDSLLLQEEQCTYTWRASHAR